MNFKKILLGISIIIFLIGMSIYVWAQQQTGREQVTLDRIYSKLEEISSELKQAGYDQITQKLDQIIQNQTNMQEDITKLKMRQRY